MSFRKTQSVEKAEVLSPAEHAEIENQLHKIGKTSAQELTPEQRKTALPSE
ncbi:MAG: hypothetical protein NVSMB52_10870 [Chloroflexota bacterium]